MNPVLVILVVLVVGVVIYLSVKAAQAYAERERQRLAGLSRWGPANGFRFSPGDPWNLDGRYQGIADIGRSYRLTMGESMRGVSRVSTLAWDRY